MKRSLLIQISGSILFLAVLCGVYWEACSFLHVSSTPISFCAEDVLEGEMEEGIEEILPHFHFRLFYDSYATYELEYLTLYSPYLMSSDGWQMPLLI